MITFGLTGGICTGKSRITRLFQMHGIPIIDADLVARQVVQIGTKGYLSILQSFGPEYFLEDESLNRKKLADLIFFNDSARYKLDSIMVPLILKEANQQIDGYHKSGYEIVGFDSALIVEWGEVNNYRPLIVIHCPPEMQITRMMRRNLLTKEEAEARLKAQLPRDIKIKLADFVISSEGSKEDTARYALSIINILKNNN